MIRRPVSFSDPTILPLLDPGVILSLVLSSLSLKKYLRQDILKITTDHLMFIFRGFLTHLHLYTRLPWEDITSLNIPGILEIKKAGYSKVSILLTSGHEANMLVENIGLKTKDLIAFIPPSRVSRKRIIGTFHSNSLTNWLWTIVSVLLKLHQLKGWTEEYTSTLHKINRRKVKTDPPPLLLLVLHLTPSPLPSTDKGFQKTYNCFM